MSDLEILKTTTNSRVYKMMSRSVYTGCSYCPPHRNDNGHWKAPRKKKGYQLSRRPRTRKFVTM